MCLLALLDSDIILPALVLHHLTHALRFIHFSALPTTSPSIYLPEQLNLLRIIFAAYTYPA